MLHQKFTLQANVKEQVNVDFRNNMLIIIIIDYFSFFFHLPFDLRNPNHIKKKT